MHKTNIEEYKIICSQIDSEYKSILAYSATLITVSGTLFAAILRLYDISTQMDVYFDHAILIIANVTLSILLIINYKCSQYNRLVGYRQLISSERYCGETVDKNGNSTIAANSHTAAYDVCMDQLNHVFDENEMDFGLVNERFFELKGVFGKIQEGEDQQGIDRYVARGFPSNMTFKNLNQQDKVIHHDADVKYSRLGCLWMLFVLIWGRKKHGKGSWRFIDYINRMVLYIFALQLIAVVFSLTERLGDKHIASWQAFKYWITDFEDSILYVMILPQFLVSTVILYHISLIWQQMYFGRRRSFSFFLQFLPFRMIYLKDILPRDEEERFLVKPYYIGIEWTDED